jgi:hypothetical protein
MFRYVLALVFAVGFASAAIISTTATCDGVTTVGTTEAICNDGRSAASAFVAFGVPPFPGVPVGEVHVDVSNSVPGGSGSATANFSEDAVFTVFGGTGNGIFWPCVSFSPHNSDRVGISFAGSGIVGLCPPPPTPPPLGGRPFTFGVPRIVHLFAQGNLPTVTSLREETAGAELFLRFTDGSGNLLPISTFSLVEVPEPSAWSLLGVGLMCLLTVPALGTFAIRCVSGSLY